MMAVNGRLEFIEKEMYGFWLYMALATSADGV